MKKVLLITELSQEYYYKPFIKACYGEEIENYWWVLVRTKVADEKNAEAHSSGLDVDNVEVLKEIAIEVNDIIKEKRWLVELLCLFNHSGSSRGTVCRHFLANFSKLLFLRSECQSDTNVLT